MKVVICKKFTSWGITGLYVRKVSSHYVIRKHLNKSETLWTEYSPPWGMTWTKVFGVIHGEQFSFNDRVPQDWEYHEWTFGKTRQPLPSSVPWTIEFVKNLIKSSHAVDLDVLELKFADVTGREDLEKPWRDG